MIDGVAPYTLEGITHGTTQHVLILAGAEDQFVPLTQIEGLARELVNARSVHDPGVRPNVRRARALTAWRSHAVACRLLRLDRGKVLMSHSRARTR